MSKVLLAGESWVSDVVDHKGFDHFPHTQVHIGCKELLEALRNAGHEVTHMRSHDVAVDFPFTAEELDEYDVVILSDVGVNTLLLPPEVFEEGKRMPNRLMVLRDWVRAGGALMMAGGYLSFQQGVEGKLTQAVHPITKDLDENWPHLLGYQKLVADADTQVLAEVNGDPLLVVGEYGRGRSVAFASDISPHWAPQEYMGWAGYQTLFDNIVRWLAKEVA